MTDFDRAIELEPTLGNAFFMRGSLHLQNNDLDLARSDLLRAYELDPTIPFLTKNLARVHYSMAEYNLAIPFCKEYFESNPVDTEIGLMYAKSCFFTNKISLCVEITTQMIVRNTKEAGVYSLRSAARYKLKDYNGAYQDFQMAKQLGDSVSEQYGKHLLSLIQKNS